MRKTIMLATVAAIAFTGPVFAQAAGSPSAAPAATTGNTNGGTASGAMKMKSARHAQAGPVGQTAPNGNVGGKMKSGANGG